MKKLLLILLLIITSCTVNKQKQKAKSFVSSETESKMTEKQVLNENVNQRKDKKDSIVLESDSNIDRSKATSLQNFNLKNNGRCADPGAVRYVQFTDVFGNKTSIPVNDNTDLNFGSESELSKENKTLKSELLKITKENETLKKEKQSHKDTKGVEKSKNTIRASDMDVKTEKRSFWGFVAVALISVIVWEIAKQSIKKYFFK